MVNFSLKILFLMLFSLASVHTSFIHKLHYRCLLHKDHTESLELIFDSIIPVCKDLQDHWLKGIVIADSKLSLLENMSRSNHDRLTGLLALLAED